MKFWIVPKFGAPDEQVIIGSSQVPIDAIAEAPIEDGKPVEDIDWLDILDVDDGLGNIQKIAVVNPTKKQAKLDAQAAKKAAQEAEKAAKEAEKQAKVDKIKGLKVSDLKNEADIKQAIVDILDYLELG